MAQENTKKGESGGSNTRSFGDGTLYVGAQITTRPHNHLPSMYSCRENLAAINKLYSLDNHCNQDYKFHYLFIGVIRVHKYCVLDNFILLCLLSFNKSDEICSLSEQRSVTSGNHEFLPSIHDYNWLNPGLMHSLSKQLNFCTYHHSDLIRLYSMFNQGLIDVHDTWKLSPSPNCLELNCWYCVTRDVPPADVPS